MAKGDGFAVCTMKKQSGGGGGLSAHIDREVYSPELDRMVPFRPASVRDDSRTALNRECIESTVKIGRTQAIWKRLSEAGFSRKKDDKQDDSKKTRKIKDSAVIALCFVCTSDEETMKKLEAEGKLDDWIKRTIAWFQKEFGKENVVSAVLHMDETSPHLHITVVPITTKEAKERKEKPKFDENGKPIKKYETDKDGNIVLDEKGRAVVKKRSYKKQEVTARLSAKDICNPVAMDRWQTDYAEAMKVFGMKRGVKGSKQKNVPAAEWQLQQINGQLVAVEKEVEEQEATKKANATTIENQEATISDNKATIEQQESSISSNTAAIQEQGDTITTNNSIIEEQSATINNMRTEKEDLEDAIAEKKQEQEKLNNSTWLDTMKGLVNKSDKDKKYLAEIARLEQLNLAVDENGEPVRYKSGNQASWPRYAEFLRNLIKTERDKIKPAVDAAVRDANNSHQQEVNRLNSKISSLNNQLMEKDKKIQELEDEKKTLLQRIKAIKDAIVATFGPKFKAAVKAIMERAEGDMWRFTRSQKKDVETSLLTQKSVDSRKELGKEAITYAKILLEDNSEWERIPAEVDQVADGKWDSHQELLDAAAAAVVTLSQTSGKKNFNATEQATINAYLNDGGTIGEIWEAAKPDVGYWSDYAERVLKAYGSGETISQGLKRG